MVMAAITHRDYEALLDSIDRLYECEDVQEFPRVTLVEMHRLIGADSAVFNHILPCLPKVFVVAIPDVSDVERRNHLFEQHLPQHAVFRNYLATGDTGAFKISDFQTEREFHSLPIYKDLYHEMGYEDQFAFMLFPPASEMIGISLARGRRSFTERDRKILNFARPHLARAYRRAEHWSRVNRRLAGRKTPPCDARVTLVRLDASNRPVQFGAQAEAWLLRFFPGRPRNVKGLPDAVVEWIPNRDTRSHALTQTQGGERLRIRLYPELRGVGRVLVLELETLPGAARASLAGRLTHREIEVMLEVERGRTNDEIAVALSLSPLTVRTHLEHIFEKLNVPNRAAAVARFHQFCSEES